MDTWEVTFQFQQESSKTIGIHILIEEIIVVFSYVITL